MDIDRETNVALGAANNACDALRDHFGRASVVRKKGIADLVTQADLASEEAIIGAIRAAFPDDSILAEESGESRAGSDRQWIIDPLDGTTNYAHGVPLFAVSIAFVLDGRTVLGLVVNPIGEELFMASAGGGATLNGLPLEVSDVEDLSDALLVTGFPYNTRECLDPVLSRLGRALVTSHGVRRLGSAALDLCWVACGRFEAFWEENLSPWDTAAGELIAREAGGLVTNFSGEAFSPEMKQLLATNGKVHEELLQLLNSKETP
ncbi:MAG: inositol monophosphatase family protein [Desulfatibacillaceae bacterium]